ncbi:MAG: hypothetical protein ACLP07_11760 [Terracidiphilus sp.]
MERVRYETVTRKESFAILIPASPEEASGEATFQMEFGGPQSVRAIRLQELKKTARELKGAAAAHFDALLALRGALETGDTLALAKAKERLERAYRLREAENPPTDPESDRQLGEVFAPFVGLSAKESLRYLGGLRSGPKAGENPSRLFSYEVSQAVGALLQNAQIVLWWMDGAFRPAIYCPDPRTALYIHTFFIAPVSGLGFRICPYDGEQFFQDRPNQEYCCPAHREAHRVARFRNEKKLRATNTETNRRKSNGTQKAR